MTTVDIVIPTHDPGPFLRIALRSVLNQTLTDWRAFVVDDGSTEDLSWVDAIDERVVRIRQGQGGTGAARNRGIAAGTASLVAFLDSDDVWLREKLEMQTATMTEQVGLSSTAFEIIDRHGRRHSDGYAGHATSRGLLLQGNGICASTTMVRRDQLDRVGPFDSDLRHAEDWDMWIRLAGVTELIKVPEILAQYRLHDTNMSNDYSSWMHDCQRVLRRYEAGADATCSRIGQRRVRALTGAKAFDAFRATRRPSHLLQALRWSPRYTTGAVLSKLRPGGDSSR